MVSDAWVVDDGTSVLSVLDDVDCLSVASVHKKEEEGTLRIWFFCRDACDIEEGDAECPYSMPIDEQQPGVRSIASLG